MKTVIAKGVGEYLAMGNGITRLSVFFPLIIPWSSVAFERSAVVYFDDKRQKSGESTSRVNELYIFMYLVDVLIH